MATEPRPGEVSLIDRAKAIILKPKDEWPRIAAESSNQGDILRSHVLPLAAIGPVASFLGGQIFGYGGFGFSFRPSLMNGITTALIGYVLSIVGVYVLSFIADFLAPKFDGTSNRNNAFKLVAYSYTAAWVVGIFGLIPALAFFGLLGLYSIYLLYLGATPLMKVPEAKAASYTAVTIVCAIALALIIAPITALISGLFISGPAVVTQRDEASSGTLTLPGGRQIDLGNAERMQRQVEDAVSGKTTSVDLDQLKTLLPGAIGSYQRTSLETTKLGALGSQGSATYEAGDKRFTLTITDMAAVGALAGIAGSFGVEQSKEDADSYERTQSVAGQMQTEAWNRTSNRGKFGKMIANRFMVEADGTADSVDQLKAAVNAIDEGHLKKLAG